MARFDPLSYSCILQLLLVIIINLFTTLWDTLVKDIHFIQKSDSNILYITNVHYTWSMQLHKHNIKQLKLKRYFDYDTVDYKPQIHFPNLDSCLICYCHDHNISVYWKEL